MVKVISRILYGRLLSRSKTVRSTMEARRASIIAYLSTLEEKEIHEFIRIMVSGFFTELPSSPTSEADVDRVVNELMQKNEPDLAATYQRSVVPPLRRDPHDGRQAEADSPRVPADHGVRSSSRDGRAEAGACGRGGRRRRGRRREPSDLHCSAENPNPLSAAPDGERGLFPVGELRVVRVLLLRSADTAAGAPAHVLQTLQEGSDAAASGDDHFLQLAAVLHLPPAAAARAAVGALSAGQRRPLLDGPNGQGPTASHRHPQHAGQPEHASGDGHHPADRESDVHQPRGRLLQHEGEGPEEAAQQPRAASSETTRSSP